MPRRPVVRLPSAPPTSLALVLCVLIAFAGLLSPAAADQGNVPQEPSQQAPTGEGAGEPGAEGPSPQTRKAERLMRRAERKAEKTAGSTGETPAPGSGVGTGSKASRKAERIERAARRTARRNASTGAQGATRTAAAPPASSTGKASEREREEKRRAHEEQRRKSGRESYKEKQARIAREAGEAEAGLGSQGSTGKGAPTPAVVASGGLAPTAGPESAKSVSAAGAGSDAVQGQKSARRPARRHGRRSAGGRAAAGGGTVATASGVAAGEGASVTPAAASRTAHRGSPSRHRRAAAAKSSPLVTTVTRIIGVVPTAIWLLIGALALAAAVFAASSRVAARRAGRLDRQRRALLDDVGLLQAALLPELPERVGPVSTTAAYRPASGPGAGGDFYDVFALPEGLVAVVVGDVSGHGRDALPHTTLLRYTLRAYLEAGLGPREALRAAAPALERQLGGSFATVVLATYDPRERLLRYSCAGHPHPLLTGLDPESAIIASSAPPIGAGRPTGTRETVVSVPGAAVAAFYTDGVIESRIAGELYGQSRLAAELERLGGEASAVSLLDGVAAQTDRRPDDMAACLLRISGGDAPPRIVSEQIELDGRDTGRARAVRFLAAAGVPEDEAARVLSRARSIAADHGSALLTIEAGEESPRLTLTHDNVAPLRARAIARTQEVAL